MAYVAADLTAIESAIASGELRVQYRDRTVDYRSIDELTKAKALIEADLDRQSGTKPVRQIRVYSGKGF